MLMNYYCYCFCYIAEGQYADALHYYLQLGMSISDYYSDLAALQPVFTDDVSFSRLTVKIDFLIIVSKCFTCFDLMNCYSKYMSSNYNEHY